MSTDTNKYVLQCKIFIALISLGEFWVFHQIDITSRHFAVAFNIPVHNISIYFDKMFSIRCLFIVIGYLIEYILYQIGGGDRDGKNEGEKTRKYVSMACFCILLVSRTSFLLVQFCSSQLAYYVYVTLGIESLVFGVNDAGFMGLGAQYMSVISMFLNISRLVVNFLQVLLDLIWYSNALIMIKIQSLMCVLLSGMGTILWFYFILELKELAQPKNQSEVHKPLSTPQNSGPYTQPKEDREKSKFEARKQALICRVSDGPDALICPLLCFTISFSTRDFLYPGTLPYAILERDKCHLINMLMPVFNNIGPLFIFILDNVLYKFEKWEWYFNWFLLIAIPLPIIFTFSIMAIHSNRPIAVAIRNSRPRVMTMTLVMIFCLGFLDPLSYIGIGKYAFRGNAYGYTVQAVFNVYALMSRSVFSRLSVGYTVTRVGLGYHLPKFRPVHRMSKKNMRWYIFREIFRRSWRDLKNDMRLDVRKYL